MEPVVTIIAGIIVTVVGGIVLQLWNSRRKRIEEEKRAEKERLEAQAKARLKLQKEIWRLRKTILIIDKILDDQLNKKHPELTANLEDIATELLKQSDKS